jgi:hypothetical protein
MIRVLYPGDIIREETNTMYKQNLEKKPNVL